VCGPSPKTVQCSELSHEVGRHPFYRERYPARTGSVGWPLPADRLATACADDSVRGRRRVLAAFDDKTCDRLKIALSAVARLVHVHRN
jgi:hypothetical protein